VTGDSCHDSLLCGSLAFRSVKTVLKAKYLGGHPSQPKDKVVSLKVDETGVIASSIRPYLTLEWDDIEDLAVEGPDQVEKRVTMTRLLTLGIFAFGAKKKQKLAYLVAKTHDGEAIFEVDKVTPEELRAKLSWALVKY
jgi:hypothetical protein